MTGLKKILIINLMTMLASGFAFSQDNNPYTTSAGIRGGLFNGITVKHFIKDMTAIEGIAGVRFSSTNLTGLYEIYIPQAFDVKNLYWYYGGGAHIGYSYGSPGWYDRRYDPHPILGVDGIIGLEYVVTDIPINVSFDVKPFINIIGFRSEFVGFGLFDAAFSIRYVFN